MSSPAFSHLHGHAYLALTTYRKTGAPVTTPVWFAQVGDRLYCITEPTAGKLKRIRNTAKVEVAPSTVRGKPSGPSAPALARELTVAAERDAANAALSQKYGIQKTLFELLWKVQRVAPAFIEIRPA